MVSELGMVTVAVRARFGCCGLNTTWNVVEAPGARLVATAVPLVEKSPGLAPPNAIAGFPVRYRVSLALLLVIVKV